MRTINRIGSNDTVEKVWALEQSQNWWNQKKLNIQAKKLLSLRSRIGCTHVWLHPQTSGWMCECMDTFKDMDAQMMHRCMGTCVSACPSEHMTMKKWAGGWMLACMDACMNAGLICGEWIHVYIHIWMHAWTNTITLSNFRKMCYNLSQWTEWLLRKCQVIKLQSQMKNLGKKRISEDL